MKCPKCNYLGFETGDRCKNCGYDFSLISAVPAERDLRLRLDEPDSSPRDDWHDRMDRVLGEAQLQSTMDDADASLTSTTASNAGVTWSGPSTLDAADDAPAPAAPPPLSSPRAGSALPLFAPSSDDDQPLVKLQAPRPPLAVRRTPDAPRLRTIPKPVRRSEPDPVLEFAHEAVREEAPRPAPPVIRPSTRAASARSCAVWRRIVAAVIDHAILLAVDLTVVYFTLRMAALTMSDWQLVPAIPMLVFLAIVKFAYFAAFTSVGGQTIGKMAAGIRVIADDSSALDPSRALRRTFIGALSVATLGLAFVPALISGDRRAPHDRMARTRVVELPSV